MKLDNMILLMPEIALIIGAILLLLFSCYSTRPKWGMLSSFAFATVIVATYQLISCFGEVSHYFLNSNFLVYSPYTSYLKITILLGFIGMIAMLPAAALHDKSIVPETLVLMMLSVTGMMLLVSSNNIISLYMALELSSLPLYIMAASKRDDILSSEAGLKYFVLGALASCFFLFGASIVYGFSGSLDFTGINNYYLNTSPDLDAEDTIVPSAFIIGIVFMVAALAFKVSAAPFHMWTPDVYQGSPMFITAFFAVVPKVATLGLMARFLFSAFVDHAEQWSQMISALSVASLLVGALGAIVQHNIKRLLAYSAIGHMGFALIGLLSVDGDGLRGMLMYIAIYMVMSLGAFSCLMMLTKDGEYKEDIRKFAGLATSHPYLAASIAVIMFSMAGIPPLAGFFAKFYVLYAAVKQEWYFLALTAVLASVIAAYYYLYIIKVMYFDEPKERADFDYPIAIRIVAGICVALNIVYVAIPVPLIAAAEAAVASLFLN
ncbi:MAG: NADH-quinone oxidoreductase subunit N [Proteobacteria bacterium]|nr:NADH-quinone oxidoreductase subunit N [Pseudomonadota bacterium]